MFEAVILAGGKGTRLRSVSGDVPKPMVDINGTPFLYRLLYKLEAEGCRRVVLSLGYNHEYIIDKFIQDNPTNMSIVFSVEDKPLGTGGAIKKAFECVDGDWAVVLNGDTLCDLNFKDFINFSCENHAEIGVAGISVSDAARYGTLSFDSKMNVTSLNEKGEVGSGIINGGVYFIDSNVINAVQMDVFSFEVDFLSAYQGMFKVFLSDGYFIDIGIPKDYYKACQELK